MPVGFKRVPAVDKSFAMLELLAASGQALGISQMAGELGLNKSTVFNLAHTLTDLGVLERAGDKFNLGLGLYLLAKVSRERSDVISLARPFLEQVCAATNLSVFLGMRSGLKAVILDKVDSPVDLKISSDVGIRIPILAGAAGKALLCQMPDQELEELLAQFSDQKFARYTHTGKKQYKNELALVRAEGIATDHEEYLEGIMALAAPLFVPHSAAPLAVWAVGLKSQIKSDQDMVLYGRIMRQAAQGIRAKFVS